MTTPTPAAPITTKVGSTRTAGSTAHQEVRRARARAAKVTGSTSSMLSRPGTM